MYVYFLNLSSMLLLVKNMYTGMFDTQIMFTSKELEHMHVPVHVIYYPIYTLRE